MIKQKPLIRTKYRDFRGFAAHDTINSGFTGVSCVDGNTILDFKGCREGFRGSVLNDLVGTGVRDSGS